MVIAGFVVGVFVGATFGLLAAGLGAAAKEGDRQLESTLTRPGDVYTYPPRCVR